VKLSPTYDLVAILKWPGTPNMSVVSKINDYQKPK
jgi:hypothetical protein